MLTASLEVRDSRKRCKLSRAACDPLTLHSMPQGLAWVGRHGTWVLLCVRHTSNSNASLAMSVTGHSFTVLAVRPQNISKCSHGWPKSLQPLRICNKHHESSLVYSLDHAVDMRLLLPGG